MRKMRTTTLAAAVSLAICGTATTTASAEIDLTPSKSPITQVLFPIISTTAADTTFTIISLVNDNGGIESHEDVRYRFRYMYKENGPAFEPGQTNECKRKDFSVVVSENFLLQFEVSNQFDISIFGDPAPVADSLRTQLYASPFPAPNTGLANGATGFLIVNVEEADGFVDPKDVSLFGEAAIINQARGLRWAYSTRDLGLPFRSAPAVASFAELDGTEKVTSWYSEIGSVVPPVDGVDVGTVWHVLPLGTAEEMTGGVGTAGGLEMFVQPETGVAFPGSFGRNERYISGIDDKFLKCFAFFEGRELLQSFGDPALIDGGWMSVAGYKPDSAATGGGNQHYMLHKIQFRRAPPNFNKAMIPATSINDMVVTRELDRINPLDH